MAEEIKNNNVAESVEAEVVTWANRSMAIDAQIKKHNKIFWIAFIGLVLSMVMIVWVRSVIHRCDVTPNTPQIESMDSLDIAEGPNADMKEDMLKGIVIAVAMLFVVSMVVGCYESSKILLLQEQKKQINKVKNQ